jgi:hypothetical protein
MVAQFDRICIPGLWSTTFSSSDNSEITQEKQWLDYNYSLTRLPFLTIFIIFQAPAQYEFKYGVRDEHTHDIKEQAEKRVGDKVEGYYKLLEADGTTRTVHYTADKHTGFQAQVVRSGHSIHPAAAPAQKLVAGPVLTYTNSAPVLSYSSGLGAYH